MKLCYKSGRVGGAPVGVARLSAWAWPAPAPADEPRTCMPRTRTLDPPPGHPPPCPSRAVRRAPTAARPGGAAGAGAATRGDGGRRRARPLMLNGDRSPILQNVVTRQYVWRVTISDLSASALGASRPARSALGSDLAVPLQAAA